MIQVITVDATAVNQIQAMAETSWPATYRGIISEAQIAYMMNLFYHPDALRRQIVELGHRFIMACDGEIPVGFAAYSPRTTPDDTTWRLHKIYIQPGQQGKGIGRHLVDYIAGQIIPLGATALELNVNRYNKAISFYEKLAFAITGEEDIDIGGGYFMNDYVMTKPLRPVSLN